MSRPEDDILRLYTARERTDPLSDHLIDAAIKKSFCPFANRKLRALGQDGDLLTLVYQSDYPNHLPFQLCGLFIEDHLGLPMFRMADEALYAGKPVEFVLWYDASGAVQELVFYFACASGASVEEITADSEEGVREAGSELQFSELADLYLDLSRRSRAAIDLISKDHTGITLADYYSKEVSETKKEGISPFGIYQVRTKTADFVNTYYKRLYPLFSFLRGET